ncbi:MAG: carbohydrate binding family 9 domain-containing protein [Gemmatimonadaceae bacterium]|nr:carbohydrate binding family 9 domain-containing protein [Gemmatimonadaceae bacterium]
MSHRTTPRWARALCASLCLAGAAGAQVPGPTATSGPLPSAVAVHRAAPVVVDGRLDEAAWSAATPITAFRQYQPVEGAAATLATEIRVLYDDRALYIGARLADPQGRAGIRAPRARRDQLLDGSGDNGAFNSLTSDKLVIELDPYHNHIDDVLFEVNPAGVRGEAFNGDDSWDPVWEVATNVDDGGWTAEMRIPYSQLRFSREAVQEWGLQIWRYVDRLNERDMWSFRRQNENGGPMFFGHLAGIVPGAQPRHLEVVPYVVGKSTHGRVAAGDPFHSSSDQRANIGSDLKYLLTTNLTLDATINPDFGQVEVDPSVLNLSASETYYDEKRPFFVAGSSAFAFGGMSCYFCDNSSSLSAFYTRRIGRPPQLAGYASGQGTYADIPDNTTILGAAKITGRTSNGYSVGILNALTDQETARFRSAAPGSEGQQMVEPLTNYFVGRVKKELRAGASSIGGILTSTLRRLGDDTAASDRLRSRASAVGLDWRHTWDHRRYRWMGTLIASDVGGSAEAITATQRSSVHYFQRPDRDVIDRGFFDTRYDPNATTMRGWGMYTRVAKEDGDWLWELAQNWRSPGFEVNDLSYTSRTGFRWMNGNIVRQWVKPTRWYRNVFASAGMNQEFNWDGLRTFQDWTSYLGIEFPNYWRLRSFVIHNVPVDDDRLTRGGPVVMHDGSNFAHVQVSTDPRQRVVLDLTTRFAKGLSDGTGFWLLQPGMALKPMPSLYVQLAPSVSMSENATQYITAVADPTATTFGGARYVFGYIRTRQVSMETRVNWTFTPNLTLQLYAQPFIASGDYRHLREFAGTRTLTMLDYGRDVGTLTRNSATGAYTIDPDGAGPAAAFTIGDPNFTARSLRGTAVLRWEYRPGSTIFLAWTQTRAGASSDGTIDFSRDQSAMWRDPAQNVFVLKVNYWMGR